MAEPARKPTQSTGKRKLRIENLRGPKTLASTEEFGNLEALAIDDLHTGTYQRVLSMDKVSEMVQDGYDMAVAGAILVNRRKNGKLYIINGQHRAAAAQRIGETHILAQVLDGLTEKEEAAMRVQANVVKTERVLERFRARQIAEDPVVLDIIRIVHKLGGKITYSQGDKFSLLAVSTLETVYKIDGTGALLEDTLRTINAAYEELTSHTANTDTMRGIAYLIQNTPTLDKKRMIDKLNQLGHNVMMQRMRAFKNALGGSTWLNYSRSIVEAYNERLSDKNRIEFPKMDSKYKVKRPKSGGYTKSGELKGVAKKNKEDAETKKAEEESQQEEEGNATTDSDE